MKWIISVLLSGILCLMQLSCSCAEKDEFSNKGLAWLMGVYPEFCVNVLRECKQQKLV